MWTTSEQKLQSSIFAGFGERSPALFRGSHSCGSESLCGKGLKCYSLISRVCGKWKLFAVCGVPFFDRLISRVCGKWKHHRLDVVDTYLRSHLARMREMKIGRVCLAMFFGLISRVCGKWKSTSKAFLSSLISRVCGKIKRRGRNAKAVLSFSNSDFSFWFHILNSNFAKRQNSIKINIAQGFMKTGIIHLHTNFSHPTNFIQFYSCVLIVFLLLILLISPLNRQYSAIKFDKNHKTALSSKIILRECSSLDKQNLWFLSY